MRNIITLLGMAFVAIASLSAAEPNRESDTQFITHPVQLDATVKSTDVVEPMVSFDPRPYDRAPCERKLITATARKANVYYSFAPMAAEREPKVACAAPVAVEKTAVLIQPVAPVVEPEPVVEPAPVVQPEPVMESLPATASTLPLVGLLGLLSLGGAALLRVSRNATS